MSTGTSPPQSNLPEPSYTGPFTAYVSVDIDAPIDTVWNVLADFTQYPEWSVSLWFRPSTVTDLIASQEPVCVCLHCFYDHGVLTRMTGEVKSSWTSRRNLSRTKRLPRASTS